MALSAPIAGPSRVFPRLLPCTSQRRAAGSSRRYLHSERANFPSRLAFAFDIDGVLKQGEHVLPQAKRVLSFLSNKSGSLPRPIPYLLMTNGGGVTEAKRREALSRDFNVEIGPNQLVQSHTPLQDYVSDYADKPVLVVGGVGDAGRKVAESYGLKHAYILQDLIAWNPAIWDRYHLNSEEQAFVKRDINFSQIPFSAVFVIHDNGMDWGLATQVITEVLASNGGVLGTRGDVSSGVQVPLILTNPDVIWGSDYPLPRIGMGAFRLGLEAVYKATTGTELKYTQFGKPYKPTYAFAEKMLRRHLECAGLAASSPLNVYMVGDNPESDIAGANGHDWNSILVRTGVYRQGEPAHVPTRIAADVEEGVQWAFNRELDRS